MFTPSLDHLFTPPSLLDALEQVSSRSSGLDEVHYAAFHADRDANIAALIASLHDGTYTPEPLKRIEIDKENTDEKRPISLGSIKDKLIQRTLVQALSPYFEEQFSDKSYAYRPGKSTLNAINRAQNFLDQKLYFVLKSDIDNFFETINHAKLIAILDHQIADGRIVRLIALFISNGAFAKYDFLDHAIGVHQGDILSPLLSNIYLHLMDAYLEEQDIPFVRYADDFVIFGTSRQSLETIQTALVAMLAKIDLALELSKATITHINDGFTFLGIHFKGRAKLIDNDRFHKSLSRLHKLAKQKDSFIRYTHKLQAYMLTLKNYYLKFIHKDSDQLRLLQEHLIDALAQKIAYCKASGTITTKKAYREHLAPLSWHLFFESNTMAHHIDLAIAKGIERHLASKVSTADVKTKIDKKRNAYAKEFASQSTLHLATKGLMLSLAKNKFVVKEYGKVKSSYPIAHITRIILEGEGFALSTDVLKAAAERAITIDLIDQDARPYASVVQYTASTTQTIHRQATLASSPPQLILAQEFVKGKSKNQINYLKYLDKYHDRLDPAITQMEAAAKQIPKTKDTAQLMGVEGSIAALYWEAIGRILDVPFAGRITQGAKDTVNSALNYAYAVLYGKIQHALVQAGLSLHVSFLHARDAQKPTLVYDMIEEFRTFVVDRTIVSMLNRSEPITLDKHGMLTKPSRTLIAKNIAERLGSYTTWRKESRKLEHIIATQCYRLADVINQKSDTYKAFIGKY